MKQATKDFLLQVGYKMWKEKVDSIGVVQHYQKRVDPQYPDVPLCSTNEKLFINITHYSYYLPDGRSSEGFELYLVHERPDERWCDLKIYSISEQDLLDNLEKYEHTLISMWKVFYEESVE